MGGYLQLEFRRHGGGGFRSGISTGDRRVYSLKKLILWTLKISSQIKHELTTLLTTVEVGYKTQASIDQTCVRVHLQKKTDKTWVVHQAPEALLLMNFSSD